MRDQMESSKAVAIAVGRCRPQVIPAYPITPQTHIVEALGAMVRDGSLPGCRFITVESEFAAMSAAIGAVAAGARSYTATASQGLLYMAEAVFNASGLGLPIVMTVANRAIGAPINIWNDQSDSMSMRDAGWIQLYAADNQAATDLHVLAFALAQEVSTPVMVCMDGFVLTHAVEAIDVPDQDVVDAVVPPLRPRQVLDPDDPMTIGAMVGPEAFTEVRAVADGRLRAAEAAYGTLAAEWAARTGRVHSAVATWNADGARRAVVVLGSVSGTVCDTVADCAPDTAVVTLTLYRPFPAAALRRALAGVDEVIVLERALTPGAEGAVTADVRAALAGTPTRISTVVAGLGGRAVTGQSLRRMLADADAGRLPAFSHLDIDADLVARELADTRPADTRVAGTQVAGTHVAGTGGAST